MTLELVLLPSWLEGAWRTREAVEWEGRTITVVSREGLLAMKRAAGRPQDLADIAKLTGSADEEAKGRRHPGRQVRRRRGSEAP